MSRIKVLWTLSCRLKCYPPQYLENPSNLTLACLRSIKVKSKSFLDIEGSCLLICLVLVEKLILFNTATWGSIFHSSFYDLMSHYILEHQFKFKNNGVYKLDKDIFFHTLHSWLQNISHKTFIHFFIWCTCTYNVYCSSDSHPEDCSANIYKSMALSVLSGLCADSKLVKKYFFILEKSYFNGLISKACLLFYTCISYLFEDAFGHF